MAIKNKTPRKTGGPYLATAVFCEGILEDMHGGLTVQRIIDGVAMLIPPHAPPEMPSKEHPVQIAPNILIVFRTGDSPGKHKLKLVIEQPNGKRSEVMNREIELSTEVHGGVHIKTNAVLSVFSSGVFWMDVILDGKRFTRMPLNVVLKREEKMTTPAKKA